MARANRFQFDKSGQLFIRAHNETLSVTAMRVGNPDRPPHTINGLDPAQTPSGVMEIVSDYFPVFHQSDAL